MTTIWPVVSEAVAQMIDYAGDWLDFIVGEPILVFFCVALPLVGIGIGVISRLLNTRA